MVRNKNNFPVLYRDEWGNPWGECPVCQKKCKCDGIIKHMISISKGVQDLHSIWLYENHQPRSAQSEATVQRKDGII